MVITAERNGVQDSIAILKFYFSLIAMTPLLTLVVVMLGFFSRALQVLIFVMIVKVFITVIEPNSALNFINGLSIKLGGPVFSAADMTIMLVSALTSLIFIQFILSKLSLALFLQSRTAIVQKMIQSPIKDCHIPTHLHICLDKIPDGYDGIIKSCEILLFYFFLFASIFYMNMFVGVLLILLIPIILLLMIVKGRKEVHVHKEMQQSRKRIVTMDDDYEHTTDLSNENYAYGRNSIIYSDFLGGFSIVILMIGYSIWQKDSGAAVTTGITALALVFSVRFAIIYTGELSRSLSKVLRQRIIVDEMSISRDR